MQVYLFLYNFLYTVNSRTTRGFVPRNRKSPYTGHTLYQTNLTRWRRWNLFVDTSNSE